MDFAAVTCERYSEVIEAKLEPLVNSSCWLLNIFRILFLCSEQVIVKKLAAHVGTASPFKFL